MEDPQEDPLAVHCPAVLLASSPGTVLFLLGDFLGVNRSRERDFLSILSIYPRFFFCILCVVTFYSAIC